MTGTPTDGEWLHIEYEHRGVRSVSSYAMVLDATGVQLALTVELVFVAMQCVTRGPLMAAFAIPFMYI